ncbi:LuxR family transcriptional regulator [Reticulibacter mediterranei]|uniref:LuxR family transcriptional regulator n=1 Tax=Reticulibacter mediterranei TaxID=2778369 RepID=A0A8J3IVI6_9CHLR|nr:LuxR C-terminal-related transcriptional regulator [Reticulibacter mediterranei]GHO97605.1 LuxR family transcriptional regulator [Reticulibacter mediterranei]
MPRHTSSQLRWSEQAQSYNLFTGDQANTETFSSDWLEQTASFAFQSRWGMYYTVRKQRVQRGSSYWYAYRRLHGRIVKRYLGRTTDLTFARLEEIAHQLESLSSQSVSREEAELEQATAQAPTIAHMEDTPVEAPPLLLSKLSPPRLHTFLLDRSRLFTLLDAGRACHLTLISAPAGFGKTTLVCQWMAARRARPDFPPLAWVSLEAADNDPLRFWRYLIAACQTFQIDLAPVQAVLQSVTPQPPFVPSSLEPLLTSLLNALANRPAQGILVLEDYHVITAPEIQETLSFFLEHLPPTLHLIMITRSAPGFSLTQLRTRNMLCEIRTADLRFSQEETTILLHHSLPFPLAPATIQRLHAHLQGWGAGLHLIELALRRTTTPTEGERVLTHFSRNNASLQEYFVSEILDLQSEAVQQFLLRTSFLSRLTASLCDAVTERQNGQETLALLERVNLFLEPLDDDSQQWYRYHALFAEAMRNEARRRFGEDEVQRLSLRASHWYETHDLSHEAIDAALAAQNDERAAVLIAHSIEEHTFPGEIYTPHTLQRWLEQLPETTLERYPVLCLSYAAVLLFQSASWQPDALTIPTLNRLLETAEPRFRVEHDLTKLGELFAFRALFDLRQGKMQESISDAEQALVWLPSVHHLWRGLSLSIVAEKWLRMGEVQQARTALFEAYMLCSAVKNHFFKRVALIKLAQLCFELGEIPQALSSFRQAIAEAQEDEQTSMLTHWRCVALLGLAALYYEGNERENARHYAQEAITLSQTRDLLHHEVHAALILARVQQAQGEAVVAQQQLTALLERIPVSSPHLAQEVQTAQASLALSIGDQMVVQRWATGRVPHPDFAQESEAELLICRWLRVQGKLEEASQRLERSLATAHMQGHARCTLDVQIEMVLVAVAEKRKTEAQQLLQEALTLAFARNAQRPFLDAGEQMANALRSLLPQLHDQPLLAYVRMLLSAFPNQQHVGAQATLIEPLSPQELRVLNLLAQHRSNADIAAALVVSVNTVRTQVQSIYSKLGVHSRSAASEFARELDLI